MKCFMISFPKGCFLVDARDSDRARADAVRQWGINNGPYKVEEADITDIAWVKAMHGRLTPIAERRYNSHYNHGGPLK